MSERLGFEAWCKELNEIGQKHPNRYGPAPVETCGAASWFGYFECGYSPKDSWDEDGTYD